MPLQTIEHDRIKIQANQESDPWELVFAGNIDMEDPGALLDSFFETVHQELLSQNQTSIVLNFKKLDFMNSSGIKSLAKWIMKLYPLEEDQKYSISIQPNKEITWQRTSLPTLTFLVPGAVKIE